MNEEENSSNGEAILFSLGNEQSEYSEHLDEISSRTEGSFFEEEDKNLIEKESKNKKNVITNTFSYTNKFEFTRNNNFFYYFFCENITGIILMNIISIILFLLVFFVKLNFQLFFNREVISNYFIILISILLIPFLGCTLIKMIILFKNRGEKDKYDENKDLLKLVKQKWNIYYSISVFLLTINFLLKLVMIDILHYHFKIILFSDILIILLSLFIFGIIYYLTKSSNNILITNLMDQISFPFSISVLFSFIMIIFIEQFKSLIYKSQIYIFLLTLISLLLMAYYDDIIFAFIIFLYQLGEIKVISFYNMSFPMFCTLINLGFIIFMSFKSIRKYLFSSNDDNVYALVEEEIIETNED